LKQTGVVTVVTIILGVLISIMDAGILQVLNLLIR
jgi:preprotein translocase subunit SecE